MATKKKKAAAAEFPIIEREPLQYYEGHRERGYIVDWTEIFRLYNMLGCPEHVYNPSTLPINDAAWFVLVSERGTGKTTNLVLIAMLLWMKYGSVSAYVRQTDEMVTPKEMKNFMNVIIANGYIQKITGGKYNGVRYWSRHYTFVKWGTDGKKEEESDPFLWVGCVTEHETYKSILNLPTCNLIIYDEFISSNTRPNEFVMLTDLHSTIGRKRRGIKICLCANTTYYYHDYFRELMIQDEVINCKVNHSFIKTTPLGTKVYYKMIGDKDVQREKVNTEYYGFDNPRLKSITGGDWAIANYPHIVREDRQEIDTSRYILFNDQYFRIDLVNSERLGLHCLVHRASSPKYAAVIFTVGEIRERRERFRYGCNAGIDRYVWKLYDENRWFYADNDVGYAVESYKLRCEAL